MYVYVVLTNSLSATALGSNYHLIQNWVGELGSNNCVKSREPAEECLFGLAFLSYNSGKSKSPNSCTIKGLVI